MNFWWDGMKKTLFEFSKSVFDKVVGISYDEINFNITDKIEYSKIEYGKNIKITRSYAFELWFLVVDIAAAKKKLAKNDIRSEIFFPFFFADAGKTTATLSGPMIRKVENCFASHNGCYLRLFIFLPSTLFLVKMCYGTPFSNVLFSEMPRDFWAISSSFYAQWANNTDKKFSALFRLFSAHGSESYR